MDTNLVISLVVLLLVVVGFVSGKFRLGLVGMAGAILLNLTGVLTFDQTFAYLDRKSVV